MIQLEFEETEQLKMAKLIFELSNTRVVEGFLFSLRLVKSLKLNFIFETNETGEKSLVSQRELATEILHFLESSDGFDQKEDALSAAKGSMSIAIALLNNYIITDKTKTEAYGLLSYNIAASLEQQGHVEPGMFAHIITNEILDNFDFFTIVPEDEVMVPELDSFINSIPGLRNSENWSEISFCIALELLRAFPIGRR